MTLEEYEDSLRVKYDFLFGVYYNIYHDPMRAAVDAIIDEVLKFRDNISPADFRQMLSGFLKESDRTDAGYAIESFALWLAMTATKGEHIGDFSGYRKDEILAKARKEMRKAYNTIKHPTRKRMIELLVESFSTPARKVAWVVALYAIALLIGLLSGDIGCTPCRW